MSDTEITFNSVSSYDPTIAYKFIKEAEGCKLTAYKCPAGIWTIGYGHTQGVYQGMTITQEQADKLLAQSLPKYQKELAQLVKVPVTADMFIALLSFLYNFGYTKCATYSLFKELNRANFGNTADWFLKYVSPGSVYEAGLLKRRTKERDLFISFLETK